MRCTDVTVVSGVKGGPETERIGKTPHYQKISVQFCVTEATLFFIPVCFFLNVLHASWPKGVHFCGIPSDIWKRLTPSSPTHKIKIPLNLSLGCRSQWKSSSDVDNGMKMNKQICWCYYTTFHWRIAQSNLTKSAVYPADILSGPPCMRSHCISASLLELYVT